jgi:cellulose synthase/poly-beta-1,6-N-acetylglucosamine synthase-like glycosyltransferase/peptidoglycan/xylan/chitin deacetylase (PgdA/CDA1 family)
MNTNTTDTTDTKDHNIKPIFFDTTGKRWILIRSIIGIIILVLILLGLLGISYWLNKRDTLNILSQYYNFHTNDKKELKNGSFNKTFNSFDLKNSIDDNYFNQKYTMYDEVIIDMGFIDLNSCKLDNDDLVNNKNLANKTILNNISSPKIAKFKIAFDRYKNLTERKPDELLNCIFNLKNEFKESKRLNFHEIILDYSQLDNFNTFKEYSQYFDSQLQSFLSENGLIIHTSLDINDFLKIETKQTKWFINLQNSIAKNDFILTQALDKLANKLKDNPDLNIHFTLPDISRIKNSANQYELIKNTDVKFILQSIKEYKTNFSSRDRLVSGISYVKDGQEFNLEWYGNITYYNIMQYLNNFILKNQIVFGLNNASNSQTDSDKVIKYFPQNDVISNIVCNDFYFDNRTQTQSEEGEIISIVSLASSGKIECSSDLTSKIITTYQITTLPKSILITKKGKIDKKIALTFDDGPDNIYTEEVLKILQSQKVKANFFIIGKNAEQHPHILQKIAQQGHLIANHSYSHPRFSLLNNEQINFELEQTNKIIYNITGKKPDYFRVPYNDLEDYDSVEKINPLLIGHNLNMSVAEYDADSKDWMTTITVEEMLNRVLNAKNKTQVLLHDGGGNRQKTIELLPKLIEQLRNLEYEFVTIDELDKNESSDNNKTNNNKINIDSLKKVDTPVTANITTNSGDNQNSFYNSFSNFFINSFNKIKSIFQNWIDVINNNARISLTFNQFSINSATLLISFIGMIFLVLGFIKLFILLILNLFVFIKMIANNILAKFINKKNLSKLVYQPISIIVPCYNEEKTIVDTVNSLLLLNYEEYEILVVDDGSKDSTYKVLINNFAHISKVQIHTKVNGGKSTALNFGIKKARYDFIYTMDADTIVSNNALKDMFKHLLDPKVGGVAGNVRVGNDAFVQYGNLWQIIRHFNWLASCQRLEYIIAQNFERVGQSTLNCITVVPGPIGLWRKKALLEIQGYSSETLAEDGDLTMSMAKRGWKIKSDSSAWCLTEAPEDIKSLWKQRFRWQFGTLQILSKYKSLLFNIRYVGYGFFALPYILLYYISIFFAPIFFLLSLYYPIKYLLSFFFASFTLTYLDTVNINNMILSILFFLGIELCVILIALSKEKSKNPWTLLIILPIYNIFYKPFMFFVSWAAVIKALEGSLMSWGHLARKGSVQLTQVNKT